LDKDTIINELTFKTTRSSGPGGQNVNKVSSKVILSFNLQESQGLTESEKATILTKLSSKLTSQGTLVISSEETRSQLKNKELAIKRLITLLSNSLIIPKKRIPTNPTKASKKRNLDTKKQRSNIKNLRKKPGLE